MAAETAASETPEFPETTVAPEAVGESATSADEALLEGELLYLASRKEEAKQAFEDAADEAPEDPEIRGWAAHLADERAEAQQPPADERAANEKGSDPLDPQSVCDLVFGEGTLSFESARIFDERYTGRRVSWSGTLKSIDSYSFDFVFGDTPGAKANVEVASTSANEFSTDAVLAVVQLPREAADELRDRVGGRVSFEGRMEKLDALMRNIFVSNGKLTSNDE